MPVTIKLQFPGGRFHATPWGRHVNEGVPEWPPSPWRLLRGIIAVWQRTCRSEFAEAQMREVLDPLLTAPQFYLPPHRVAHTRHYMPWEKKGPGDRTLVFDTFVSVKRSDSLLVNWPEAELNPDQRTMLAKILSHLTSLGRAEGWVQAELSDEQPDWNCSPADEQCANPVPVFCPDPQSALRDEYYPKLDPKKLAKGKVNPADFLFNCPRWHLCLDTQTIHENKWPQVPGARWVNYTRPAEHPTIAKPVQRAARRESVTVARFMLDGPVLPLTTETIRVAEMFRLAAMCRFGGWCKYHPEEAKPFLRRDQPERFSSPALAGKDLDGNMADNHDHAHYLPTAEGDDPRRITHVTIYAPCGFGSEEVAALTGLRTLVVPAAGGRELPLRVQLIGLGQPSAILPELARPAQVWESVTPFVVHRHLKRRGTKRDTPHLTGPDPRADFLRLALTELVGLRQLGELLTVETLNAGAGQAQSYAYRRTRDRRSDDGTSRACGFFRLTFAQAVAGPICLGFASHFGLGLFRPAT